MVLGIILETILGSKSHPTIDKKSDQIFYGCWKDFGSQNGSTLDHFWLQKWIKNQGRVLYENRERMKVRGRRQGRGSRDVVPRGKVVPSRY